MRKTYYCVVRVGGSLYNEVEKHGITAAEIIMLQSIHGEDAVRHIKEIGESDENDMSIRDRMANFYGTGHVETGRSGADLVRQFFGPKSMPLPKEVEGAEAASKETMAPAFVAKPNITGKPASLTAEA
jgi:hypothetical protein